jgi:hypothetical protein
LGYLREPILSLHLLFQSPHQLRKAVAGAVLTHSWILQSSGGSIQGTLGWGPVYNTFTPQSCY